MHALFNDDYLREKRYGVLINMNTYDIVILDSGVDSNILQVCESKIMGFSIVNDGKNYCIDWNFNDILGHGTAIYSIIERHNNSAKILNIKIFNYDSTIDEEKLLYTLNYIYNNIDAKFINMSLGLPMPTQKDKLESIINKLFKKGTTIISAFDNSGCMSYPAAFKNVIGVSSNNLCKKVNEFIMIENSPVNIFANGNLQRVCWLNNSYIITGGNSFACAHFTGIISKELCEKKDDERIHDFIKRKSKYSCSYPPHQHNNTFHTNNMKKAAIMPFNKEMHSLIRYEELLEFKIVAIYDSKYTSKVGANTNVLLGVNKTNAHIIKNIDYIDWDEFDSIIIGHIGELSESVRNDTILSTLINDAISRNKIIYSFDPPPFQTVYKDLFYPKLNLNYLNGSTCGKLYRINKPILCVVGTSSKQGKFTLQLELRKRLCDLGYKIGQLGTEPSSLLFGMEGCFHFGYNANCTLSNEEFISYVNQTVEDIAESDCDIIISGCQSETLHHDVACLENSTFTQLAFLMGLQPDAVVLVVNPYDDIEYIKRTILLLKSFIEAELVGIVIFPMNYKNMISGIYGGMRKLSQNEINILCEQLNGTFNVPVYGLDDLNGLVDDIINFFS